MPLIACVRFTNVVTEMEDRELLRWPTTRLMYWYPTTSAIPFAGLRTGSMSFSCSFSAASASDMHMTREATRSNLVLTVLVLGKTATEVVAVLISSTSSSRNFSCRP